eukprot:TRINITY_DN4424_c0_g1_i4.p1 TRINITY_DN4424_c0_g1~~TRINITY_DN4424_c0_g1_i4.p1  ORF type:complete len:2277 (-),score=593.99 TRINITY_DN4424_c0_g1_i4:57-6887(-)
MVDDSVSSDPLLKGVLILEDGSRYPGISFGAPRSLSGECVFHTGMVGYVESITDPSYTGQVLVFAYPMVGNYGVPPLQHNQSQGLPMHFESERAHTSAIIVSDYCASPSHWRSTRTLGQWLRDEGVPGLYGVDTRAVISRIREKGSMLCKIVIEGSAAQEDDIPMLNSNNKNLVAQVSTKTVHTYQPSIPRVSRVVAVDCGMKCNQLRCFLDRGVEVTVVPWDYNFLPMLTGHNKDKGEAGGYQGLFISNGPGDPMHCTATVEYIKQAMALSPPVPIFGVCMGNQLMGVAAGARTYKMKYGNRGLNQPCTDQRTKRCHITSQNHGYAVDHESLPEGSGWQAMFINANDGSCEGIYHTSKPFFSVQFHPEASAGPTETSYLFDMFCSMLAGQPYVDRLNQTWVETRATVGNASKVLVLGSGGLSIGQAGEFDYSGSQAIKALKEEGVRTVLINPNVATVQTSPGLADKVYFLPVTPEYVTKVIENERPDALLATFGGQTALNCAVDLYKAGVLERLGVRVLGTPVESIIATEDRGIFAEKLAEINERIAPSMAVRSIDDAIKAATSIGYPVIVRAAFCLGGLGSGFADNTEELVELCTEALASSEQILIEKSLKGWKEIEYEVVRDSKDNTITVCNMENLDPLGIHTGESIVVAPSQTLNDREYQMLRLCAIKVVRHLGVVGECNIQYALNPDSEEYCIIEVNARLSRSSALASKATGYPLAFVAAKLALGYDLPSLKNTVTKKTTACFEPALDYVVVKMPRWDLKKFHKVSTRIGSSMKSVGEVMAIGRTFEEAIQKALRMVSDFSVDGFQAGVVPTSEDEMVHPTDRRIFVIASAFKDGYTVDQIHNLTKIDKWFLAKLQAIIRYEQVLTRHMGAGASVATIPDDVLRAAKRLGFSDKGIGRCTGTTESAVRETRKDSGIVPYIKRIDTVAGEFPASNNYLYVTYNAQEDDPRVDDSSSAPASSQQQEESGVYMVLGSGAYKIGSSVEFDWCAVSCVRTLRALGHRAIMVNYNPETVSTDYDECDFLFFDELSLERVLDLYDITTGARSTAPHHDATDSALSASLRGGGPGGVILSVGGQIPNTLAMSLSRANVRVLGTHPDMIDNAENRYKFSRLLDTMGVDQPRWKELTSVDEAGVFCDEVGYPCLVRPSYVLSGAAMNVVHSAFDLQTFLTEAAAVSRDHPVVISKFIQDAKEIEVDGVAHNGDIVLYALSEHVENAGVHSGDATIVCPAQDLEVSTTNRVLAISRQIASALNISGPFNIQYLAKDNEVKVIECNLRASRSFPFVSKTYNINFIELAAKITVGAPYVKPQLVTPEYVGVKVPQFSFTRLKGADPVLGVEMASTGEVGCFGKTRNEAYLKGLISTGFKMPRKNILLSIGSFKEKHEFLPFARKIVELGFVLFGTPGTADFLNENGIVTEVLDWKEASSGGSESEENLTHYLMGNKIDLFINLPSSNKNKHRRPASFMSRGYLSRRMAVDFQVPLVTNIKCAKLFVDSLPWYMKTSRDIQSWDMRSSGNIITLPGLIDVHVHLREPGGTHKEDFDTGTAAALAGGFTVVGAMPNTRPPIVDQEALDMASAAAQAKARCDYGLFVGAGLANTQTVSTLAPQAFALKMYLEDTFGPLVMEDSIDVWRKHVANWPAETEGNFVPPICVHACGRSLAAVLFLGHLHTKPMHVCHVSTREDIELIRQAKLMGVRVTCEVTAHHLFLSKEKDGARLPGGWGKVCPGLATEADREALWKSMDIIDCIASDHAPHTHEEKEGPNPPPGFPGLETTLPLMLTAVDQGRITLAQLVEKLHTNPSRIFGIPIQPDTWVEVDMDEHWTLPTAMAYSKCQWTPFRGMHVVGKIRRVVLRGELAYLDGKVLAKPGYGQDIRKMQQQTHQHTTSSSAPHTPAPPVLPTLATHPTTTHSPAVPSSATIVALPPTISLATTTPAQAEPEQERASKKASKSANKMPASLIPGEGHHVLNGRSVLTVSQFTRKQLHALLGVAHEMRVMVKRTGSIDLLRGKILACLFFEPSTRTQCSFSAAMERLGGSVITVNSDTSSVSKGESLPDTIRTLECYTDLIVMRHPSVGAAEVAARYCQKPVINAGDGVGEHPTQALLDVFTIREELGTVNGLVVTLVGDLKHGRTVHSLVRLLSLYQVVLHYVSPPSLRMPREIMDEIRGRGVPQHEHDTLDEVLPVTNVLYVTRVQKERFEDSAHYEKVKSSYIITPETLTRASANMIVMHPLPRLHEISMEVDSDPRAAYFRQMENGMYVRMALLAMVLGKA